MLVLVSFFGFCRSCQAVLVFECTPPPLVLFARNFSPSFEPFWSPGVFLFTSSLVVLFLFHTFSFSLERSFLATCCWGWGGVEAVSTSGVCPGGWRYFRWHVTLLVRRLNCARKYLYSSFSVTGIDKNIVSVPRVVFSVLGTIEGLVGFAYVHYVNMFRLLIVRFCAKLFLW